MERNYRVHALGAVAGTEFVYDVTADSARAALEEAYARHGRRIRDGEPVEALGSDARVVALGAAGDPAA